MLCALAYVGVREQARKYFVCAGELIALVVGGAFALIALVVGGTFALIALVVLLRCYGYRDPSQSHVKCMALALSRHKNVGKYMVLGSRSLQSHVKCIVLVLSRPENMVNHMVLAFTQPQNHVKYMVLASSKPYTKGGYPNYHMPKADVQITICQRRMSNYHMPKADVQRGSAAIAVAGKLQHFVSFWNPKPLISQRFWAFIKPKTMHFT